jgi:hypothetical protein
MMIGGWSKLVSGDGGGSGEDYSVYADVLYADGSTLWGQHASFPKTPGLGWQYSFTTIDLGGKKIANIVMYGLFRGCVGVAAFSELYLGVPPAGVEPLEFTQGSATPGDRGSVSISSTLSPPGWKETMQLGAAFTGHSDHIRCDGSLVTTPAPGQARPGDKAVSIRFSLPLDASGWKVFADADRFQQVPMVPSSSVFQGGGLSQFGSLPGSVSQSPLFVAADAKTAVLGAFPMENTVWVNRIVYNAATKTLDLTFDFGLTAQSMHFPAMATFSFLLAWVPGATEPFRAGLQRYYDLHPQIFAHENRIHDQGAWMPFINDFHSIPNVADFGMKFQEGGGNVSESKYMNQIGVDILPYIEPGLMHWSLPTGMPATYENLNRTVYDCALNATQQPSHPGNMQQCQQIVADAMVDS